MPTTKKNKKQSKDTAASTHVKNTKERYQLSLLESIVLMIVSIGILYGAASLAIDSGSLWQYAVAFAGLHYAIKFMFVALRLLWDYKKERANGGSTKKTSTRKARG